MEGTGIRETVIEEIRGLAKRHGVRKVILFGSRARGDYRRASDIFTCRETRLHNADWLNRMITLGSI